MKNPKQEALLKSERIHHRRNRGRYRMADGFEEAVTHVPLEEARPWLTDTVTLSVNGRIVWVDWEHPRGAFHWELFEGADPSTIAIPLGLKRYRRPRYLHVRLCWPFGHNGTRASAEVIADFTRAVLRRKLTPSCYAAQLGYTHYTLQQWLEDEEYWCLLPHVKVPPSAESFDSGEPDE